MVREQLQARGISNPAVLAAMASVPRHLFVQEALRAQAYEDAPLPIGYGQTISQPYIVALMSELLEVERGMRVLEIGTGSGYQAAVLATMGCTVFTVERLRELYQSAGTLLRQLSLRGIHMQRRDGTLGMPEAALSNGSSSQRAAPRFPILLWTNWMKEALCSIPVGSRPQHPAADAAAQGTLGAHPQRGSRFRDFC